jgi:hypothetical protein
MILFLDLDGVLHPAVRGRVPFCHTPLLWQILRACPQAKVIFSTSWRDTFDPVAMLDFVTYGGGEDLEPLFVGETPNLEDEGLYGRRDLEIQRWLDTNNHAGPWLALDDMVELFSGGHPNLYVCDGNRGLTDADVVAIIERMQNAEPDLNLAGTFVETAYTLEHIERTIEEEKRLGIRNDPCAFLDNFSPKGMIEQITKTTAQAVDTNNEEESP